MVNGLFTGRGVVRAGVGRALLALERKLGQGFEARYCALGLWHRVGGSFYARIGLLCAEVSLKALQKPLQVGFACFEQSNVLGSGVCFAHPNRLVTGTTRGKSNGRLRRGVLVFKIPLSPVAQKCGAARARPVRPRGRQAFTKITQPGGEPHIKTQAKISIVGVGGGPDEQPQDLLQKFFLILFDRSRACNCLS